MNAVTVAFLGVLALVILGGARVALWIYDQHQAAKQVVNSSPDDWARDEWWRR